MISKNGAEKLFNKAGRYALYFLKWLAVAGVVGIISGLAGALFDVSLSFAAEFRGGHTWIIWLLPICGLVIAALYKLSGVAPELGTSHVLNAVRAPKDPPLLFAPLTFLCTFLTHLFGGSAGREGAALQIGGSIGTGAAHIFKLDSKDKSIAVLCGMSAFFTALFGTPLTAALFSLEVISVGVIYYSALLPCLAASYTAYAITGLLNIPRESFIIPEIPAFSFGTVVLVAVLAALTGLLSSLFCITLDGAHKAAGRYLKNTFVRIFAGGVIVVAITFLCGSFDYNGAGMDVISLAISGTAKPEAFILKLALTAVTIASGYKGGEIVPSFFIGSVFGCIIAPFLGLPAGFGAAVGLIAMFCGVVNCPIASVFLSIELFGAQGIPLFFIACCVSYVCSSYYGLYKGQKIVYSKLRAEYIDVNTK